MAKLLAACESEELVGRAVSAIVRGGRDLRCRGSRGAGVRRGETACSATKEELLEARSCVGRRRRTSRAKKGQPWWAACMGTRRGRGSVRGASLGCMREGQGAARPVCERRRGGLEALLLLQVVQRGARPWAALRGAKGCNGVKESWKGRGASEAAKAGRKEGSPASGRERGWQGRGGAATAHGEAGGCARRSRSWAARRSKEARKVGRAVGLHGARQQGAVHGREGAGRGVEAVASHGRKAGRELRAAWVRAKGGSVAAWCDGELGVEARRAGACMVAAVARKEAGHGEAKEQRRPSRV